MRLGEINDDDYSQFDSPVTRSQGVIMQWWADYLDGVTPKAKRRS